MVMYDTVPFSDQGGATPTPTIHGLRGMHREARAVSYGPPVLPGAPGTGVVAGAPDGKTDVGGRLLGSSSMV